METRTCCAAGHREIPADKIEYVRQELRREIEQAVADGITEFICGTDEGAALEFAMIVAEKKKGGAVLFLEIVIPDSNYLKQGSERLGKLLCPGSGVKLMGQEYGSDYSFAKSRYMIGKSERMIAVSDEGQPEDDTVQAIRMAGDHGLMVRIIDMSEMPRDANE